jgi:pilus assembly protein Flp/PilA
MGERSMSTFRRFVQDDSGATAIEYGLIAALVSVAIIVALGTLGNNLNNTFSTVAEELGSAAEDAGEGGE